MSENSNFHSVLAEDLRGFLQIQKNRYPADELLKIDLHCHDYNSDVPDELLGRILNVPETWLPTERLVKTLQKNKVNVITVTNHNNARSCYELQEKGMDVLVGAEFSCWVPDFNIGIHVLTYGFNFEQEVVLNKLRKNLYQFLQYTCEQDLPTIWAHPLYHYSVKEVPSFDFFSKMVLLFERFETLNGQRDTWQNMLVKSWLETITPELLEEYAIRFNIKIELYCKNRYKKSMSGGSDSHMGIFSGQTGSYLHIPNLKERIKTESPSLLALEAIRKGDIIPYGTHQNSEKLTVAFLDYVCQIAMYKEDPGMLRILLHKGTFNDKLLALFVTNAFSELKRHKVTMRFVELFHDCFIGKVPSKAKRLLVPKIYKPVFDEALKIAKANELEGEQMIKQFSSSIQSIGDQLNNILFSRITEKVETLLEKESFKNLQLVDIINRLEIPSEFRALTGTGVTKRRFGKKMVNPNISNFLDGLPFPSLASTLILGAHFTSAKVMYNSRPLLKTFANQIGKYQHPKRMLWLTDTFEDKNGVSSALQEIHKEIKRRNLPIDLLVCSNTLQSDDHLIVVKPLAEFTLPFYQQQPVRIPNFTEIHHLFLENEYDRIMCSTEGVMGIMSLYLKNAYTVPAYFFMHTDWLVFARKVLNIDSFSLGRVRRMLRAFYSGFDDLFVLNSEHKNWLTDDKMAFDPTKVHLTAHWCNEHFFPKQVDKQTVFEVSENKEVLLYVGRLSQEKGVFDLVDVYSALLKENENIQLVIAGTGPAEEKLKELLPTTVFMGWVEVKDLPNLYSAADLLILPSKFDTFSCVVLEALSCGLPVAAYKSKGPKDILENQQCGFLAAGKNEMIQQVTHFFSIDTDRSYYRENAILRAKNYEKEEIVDRLIDKVGLSHVVEKKMVLASV